MATKTTLSLGGIVSLAVRLIPAKVSERLDLKVVCECGTACKRPYICPADGRTYSWHGATPYAGLEVAKGTVVPIPRADLDAAKVEVRHEHLQIEAIVDAVEAMSRWSLGDKYLVLPPTGEIPFERAYAIVTAALHQTERVALTRLTFQTRTHRLVLISDGRLLRAYKVQQERGADYEPPEVAEAEVQGAKVFLSALYKPGFEFTPEPDPTLPVIERVLTERGYSFAAVEAAAVEEA